MLWRNMLSEQSLSIIVVNQFKMANGCVSQRWTVSVALHNYVSMQFIEVGRNRILRKHR